MAAEDKNSRPSQIYMTIGHPATGQSRSTIRAGRTRCNQRPSSLVFGTRQTSWADSSRRVRRYGKHDNDHERPAPLGGHRQRSRPRGRLVELGKDRRSSACSGLRRTRNNLVQ